MTAIQLFGVALSFLLGEMLLPPYVNRALAAKSASASRSGFIMAGLFVIVWLAIVAVLGVLGHVLLPADTVADNVFVALARHLLPSGFYGLLLAAVIAIVMSSQESVLNSGSVTFVRDIVGTLGNPSERATLLLAKGSTLGLAAVAIYAAHFAPSIIDGLLILYSIWAPTIILPLLIALYCRKTRPLAGCLAMLLGGTSSLLWQTVLKEPHGIPAILVGMVVAGIAYGVGHAFGNPIDESQQQSN
jgi:SSS family solute:Na+ symporter